MPKIKPPWCSIISLSLLHLYTSSPPKTILTTTPLQTSRVVQLIYFLTISYTLLKFFTEHSLHLLTWYIILWETCYSLRTPYPWFSSLLQGHILRHTPYIIIELSQCFPCSLILLSDNYPCSFVAYVISFLQPPRPSIPSTNLLVIFPYSLVPLAPSSHCSSLAKLYYYF